MSLAPVDILEEDAADLQFPKGNFYYIIFEVIFGLHFLA